MNPWTQIALPDYEGHMALPSIGQAAMLADEFHKAVAARQPKSVALLGCAGGNGLDALYGSRVDRIVCVDINSTYLATLQQRHQAELPGLECHACQMETFRSPRPVELVFGGLIFEYTRLEEALESVALLLTHGGDFYALLQLPVTGLATVSPSPYAPALTGVAAFFRHVDTHTMIGLAEAKQLQLVEDRLIRLASGKSFALLRFRRGRSSCPAEGDGK